MSEPTNGEIFTELQGVKLLLEVVIKHHDDDIKEMKTDISDTKARVLVLENYHTKDIGANEVRHGFFMTIMGIATTTVGVVIGWLLNLGHAFKAH